MLKITQVMLLKKILQQISIITSKIYEKLNDEGAIKHYIGEYGYVPLRVIANYLTFGNLTHLYGVFRDTEKRVIAKFYSNKYDRQYRTSSSTKLFVRDLQSALKIINLVRNKCAHEERLFNTVLKSVKHDKIRDYFGLNNPNNRKIVVFIIYLKVILDKKYFKSSCSEPKKLFDKYKNYFKTVSFDTILGTMGID